MAGPGRGGGGAPVRPCSGESAPSGPPLGPLMRSVQPPVRAGDQAPGEPTLGPLRRSVVVRLRPGDPRPVGHRWGPCGAGHLGLTHTRNTARQVVDGLRTEVWGQQEQSNDPGNNEHHLNMSTTQLLGAADAQTAHPATFSTASAHQPLGSANAETTPAGALAASAARLQRPDATCEGKTG